MLISVLGLGYVGLPLALAFSKKYRVVGFDIDQNRIDELKHGVDKTREVDRSELSEALDSGLILTNREEDIQECNIYVVTVPTPVTALKTPDLSPLLSATRIVGKALKKNDIVIYESTVYPGCTEEDCVPVLEEESGLKYNIDFFCAYSPERISPGDKNHILSNIKKIVSGSNPEVTETVSGLYASIIDAGIYKASSIKVAEAAKAVENAQRDVNISFVNELALIFDRMGVDTHEVLEAAATKWNFLRFKPGLVGGHCIGVDPYYLLHKSQLLGYNPKVILSGREVNDEIGRFVASKVVKLMIRHNIRIAESRALVLGFCFKENCPDIRNTKVIDVIDELKDFGLKVDVYDPLAIKEDVLSDYGIQLLDVLPDLTSYNSIILTVAHDEFKKIDFNFVKNRSVILFDVKGIVDKSLVHGRL